MSRIALLSLAFLAACDVGAFAPDRMGGGGNTGFSNNNAEGFLRGDLATVRGFDDGLAMGWADIGPGYSYVELHVDGPYGWAMIGMNVNGTLGSGALAPGNTVTLNSDSWNDDDDDSVDGSVIGCSGPDTWDTVTDEPAEEATLSISENPDTGALELTVVADFGADGTITGGATISSGTVAR